MCQLLNIHSGLFYITNLINGDDFELQYIYKYIYIYILYAHSIYCMYECVVCVCVCECEFWWKLSMGFFEVLLKLFNEAGRYEWQLCSSSYTLLQIEMYKHNKITEIQPSFFSKAEKSSFFLWTEHFGLLLYFYSCYLSQSHTLYCAGVYLW